MTDAIVFVVDSHPESNMTEAKDALHRMLAKDELKDSILLVLANKQDLPNAKTTFHIRDQLELRKLRSRNWFIQG